MTRIGIIVIVIVGLFAAGLAVVERNIPAPTKLLTRLFLMKTYKMSAPPFRFVGLVVSLAGFD